MEAVATGYVRKGRLEIRGRKALAAQLKRMRDGEVLVTIEKRHATRSAQANRFYWGVCVDLLSEHLGYTPDEVHEILKAKFIPKKLAVTDGNGEIKGEFVIGGTTTSMNKLEFGEFIDSIRQWAAEDLHVVIPDPDSGHLWGKG